MAEGSVQMADLSSLEIMVDDFEPVLQLMANAGDRISKVLIGAIYESELYLQREVQERTPIGGTGFLRQSIFPETPELLQDNILGVVGSPLKYAESVELGTKPHWAPIQPLIDWVEQKLQVPAAEAENAARHIQFKIAHRGTKGAFMFKQAFDRGGQQIQEIFDEAAKNIIDGLTP